MTYNPTNWKAGDTVTSAKLNKMEQGIANGGGMTVIHIDNEGILDKTWQEIYDIGCGIVAVEDPDNTRHTGITADIYSIDEETYHISLAMFEISDDTVNLIPIYFIADSPSDYPRAQPTEAKS